MKIQTKLNIVFMLCSFLFVGIILFFYVTEKSGIEAIFKIDSRNKEEAFDRVSSLIGYSLDAYVYDCTYWDEMVSFVNTGNKEWADQNINASLVTYKANTAWVYGLDKNILYRAQDLADSFYDVLPIPQDEIGKLFDSSAFCHFFVDTPQGVMEIRGATIHPSQDKDRKAPAKGYFFAGRLWDANFLKSLSKASSTSVAIVAGSTIGVTEMNAKKGVMTFSRTLNGWSGIPAATVMIQTRSKIIPAVNAFSRIMMFMLIYFSAFILLMFIISLTLWVINPMRLILQSLFKEDPSILARLAKKRDEMGRIANLIEIFFQQRQQLVDEIGIRKRAEDELRKEKELSESIINTAQVILLLLDIRGRIVTYNPYMEQISGYKSEEVKGKDWIDTFIPLGAQSRIRELLPIALAGIQTKGSINAIIAKDGHEIQIEWYDKTIKGANGNVEGLLSIGIDVTERKRLEEEARKRLQELEVFYKASMGREERILELKKEIEGLKEKPGK